MKIRSVILIVALTVIAANFSFSSSSVAQSQRSILDGVFTEAQAVRGERIANNYSCSYCHGGGLVGGIEDVPPLVGNEFIGLWNGRPLSDLYRMVKDMPPDSPDRLSPQSRVDVIAYLLWLNWYPGGEYELPPDQNILDEIQIVLP